MLKKFISIVIPAYNEQERILPTLKQISSFIEKQAPGYEIIIVNDGSFDNTMKLVSEFKNPNIKLINLKTNQGKGAAVKAGVLAAKGELILLSDADQSTPITEIKKFLQYATDYDIIIGSRALPASDIQVHQPLYKEVLGRIGNYLIRTLSVKGIKDTQCGFKMFTPGCKKLFEQQRVKRWGFDIEVLFLAQKCGFKIREVPVVWKNDPRTRVGLSSYLTTFFELLMVRFHYLFNHYHC